MNLVLLLIGVAIAGAFAVAAMARFRRIASTIDAFVMTCVGIASVVIAFAPDWTSELTSPLATWPEGQPPPELQIAAATAVVTSVFAIRTALVGEANLLFGTIGVWGLLALIAVSPTLVFTFLSVQLMSWLAWFEVNRRDKTARAMSGTRWLLWTIVADLPLAFAIVHINGRAGSIEWTTLQSLVPLVGDSGANDPSIALLVIGLVIAAAARFALYPFSSWQARVVATSRVGRGFAQAMLAIPVGLILLERATELWPLSPVAQLMVVNWSPMAILAAGVISLGTTRSSTTLAAAVSAMLGVVVIGTLADGPVSWPAVVLACAAIRPAWSRTSQIVCGLAFALLWVTGAAPVATAIAMQPPAWPWTPSQLVVFDGVCLIAIAAAARATALGDEQTQPTDEKTHPRWPGILYLVAAVAAVELSGNGGVIACCRVLGWENGIAAGVAITVGLIAARIGTQQKTSESATQPTTVRLARKHFYVDEIVGFCIVLPTRAFAQLTRFSDWSVLRGSLVGLSAGVMRVLDEELSRSQREHAAPLLATIAAVVAIVVIAVVGVS